MIASMTGFGRAVIEKNGRKISVEMKSVNHRFCEISIKMPRQLISIEDKIKKVISGRIRRGRLEAYITIDGEPISKRSVQVDWNLLDQLMAAGDQMKERYGFADHLTLDGLLRIEDAVRVQEEYEEQDGLQEAILCAAEKAAEELLRMRMSEGRHLLRDIEGRLDEVRTAAEKIQAIAPDVHLAYTAKLSAKLQEMLKHEADDSRIAAEAAIFAEKADITEEITRIYSHLHQFSEALELDEAVGRKLDFIVQELNREANTIGSKANDARIAAWAVELKSIIEKIKEQVQNVE
ncbi:YicC family protein [Bacillus sp. FJAT-42376]|uniref:YicC/YloC family endoribonuclease n=1 Tax=Bacillus sp. FJAT-42376 TaxID=2014076 RepID=UPI000F4DD289|nr:YicC/YloC family endoribonuclease [Bacillus sp. FJAT-42376]AZB42882.1 YicC family protein [Bacillus sp. FJAT-42376]